MKYQTFLSCFQCLNWLLKKSKREEKKNLGQKISGKTQNSKVEHFFILVSDLDSGSDTVSDLDNNSFFYFNSGLLAVQIRDCCCPDQKL